MLKIVVPKVKFTDKFNSFSRMSTHHKLAFKVRCPVLKNADIILNGAPIGIIVEYGTDKFLFCGDGYESGYYTLSETVGVFCAIVLDSLTLTEAIDRIDHTDLFE